jgi:iron complex outermembrane recepter protein
MHAINRPAAKCRTSRFALCSVMLTCAAWPAHTLRAQAAAGSDQLQEIVVTAQKRESTVQSTPISITALSGEMLQDLGYTNVLEIASLAPGISARSSGPGQTEFEMRGLASTAGSAPTVGFYLDEAPLTPAAASLNGKVVVDPNLFDLNRIEVLRGPQGTLYGAGSMGGTIKLVTNPPKLNTLEATPELDVSGTAGNGFNRGGNLMLNLPLVEDRLAARIVVSDQYTDGWIDRIVLNPFPTGPGGNCGYYTCQRGDVLAAPVEKVYEHSNWEQLDSIRGSLLFKVDDRTSITALGMYQTIVMGGYSQYDSPPNTEAHYQPIDQSEPFSDRFKLFTITVDHDFNFAKLTATGAYYDRFQSQTADTSEQQQALLGADYGLTGFSYAPYTEIDTTLQRSAEVRLTSSTSGPIQWIVGGFGSDFQSVYNAYTANSAWAAVSTGGAAANPLGIAYQVTNPYHVDQYALFGEGTYSFANHLEATVGLRWYRYQTDFNYEQAGFFSNSGNATKLSGGAETSSDGFNPKFNLAYIPTGDLTLYATIAKGFRPGGANTPVPANLCGQSISQTYASDSIWNYEIGEKARFLDDRLSINADLYYIQWKNIQQFLLIPSCGFTYTGNAGDAEAYGPEIEVNFRPTNEITVAFSGAYTKSQITSVAPSAQGFKEAANQPIEPGLAIENVPIFTASGRVAFDHPMGDNYRFLASAIESYTGSQHDAAFYYQELPGYANLSGRLGLSHNRFEAFLFGDNLANKQAPLTINTTSFSVLVPSYNRVSTNQPRTIGLQMLYRYP